MPILVHIVDDDDAVRESLQALIAAYGYETCSHSSADDFLRCTNNSPDCLLVDHHMPGMTGMELLEHLFAQGDHRPTMMITGRGDSGLAARAAAVGASYVNKPVDDNKLMRWLEQSERVRLAKSR